MRLRMGFMERTSWVEVAFPEYSVFSDSADTKWSLPASAFVRAAWFRPAGAAAWEHPPRGAAAGAQGRAGYLAAEDHREECPAWEVRQAGCPGAVDRPEALAATDPVRDSGR